MGYHQLQRPYLCLQQLSGVFLGYLQPHRYSSQFQASSTTGQVPSCNEGLFDKCSGGNLELKDNYSKGTESTELEFCQVSGHKCLL